MVGLHLKGGEDGCDDESPQILALVGEHHTGYHRRQVGQGNDLPDVSGGDDDEEVAGERPHDGAQHRKRPSEVEGAE